MQRRPEHRIDPRLDRFLRRAIAWGVVAVALLPAARGHNAWLGWMPLWLLGMPLSAWWALHGFALPRRARAQAVPLRRRRHGGAQARRFGMAAVPRRLPRAA